MIVEKLNRRFHLTWGVYCAVLKLIRLRVKEFELIIF